MTKKPFFLKAIVLLLFFSFPAAAQETLPSDKTTVETQSDDVPAETAETTDGQSAAAGDSEKTAPAAAASSSAAAASQSTAQSREPDYEEIFRWGMDDQILSTLKTLTEEKKTVPAELIDRLYAETLSESVKAACLDYWRETENALRYDAVLNEWSELPQRSSVLQSASLKYLFAFLPEKEDEKTVGVLSDVLRYADFKVQTELMELIAEKGMTVFEPVLTELGQTSEDRPALQAAVLKTLGKLKKRRSARFAGGGFENSRKIKDAGRIRNVEGSVGRSRCIYRYSYGGCRRVGRLRYAGGFYGIGAVYERIQHLFEVESFSGAAVDRQSEPLSYH